MRTIEQTFQQLTALIADQTRDLAMAMAELRSVAQQRDDFAEALQRNCVQYVEKQQALIAERDALKAERNTARQSLRAAEADLADLEADNSTLRTVNLRILADCRAAMQRADTAEAILRAKA